MIAKENRGRADDTEYLESILEDTSRKSAHAKVGKELAALRRGLAGERTVAHILDREFGASDNHLLLHDLRLVDGIGGYAQFDHILLSRLSRTASIIETKNFSGRLSRNEHDEWTVWYGKRPKDIPSPIAQARRSRDILKRWFADRGHDQAFKMIGVFVVVPPECTIDRSRIGADIPVMKADNFYQRWVEFGGISNIGRLFSAGVAAAQLRRIGEQLARDHVPACYDWDRRFGFDAATQVEFKLELDSDHLEEPPDTIPVNGASRPAGACEPTEDAVEPDVDYQAEAVLESDRGDKTPAQVEQPQDADVDRMEDKEPSRIRSNKASPAIEVVTGIWERTLPDGRIAFRAKRHDNEAHYALASICKGTAQWIPLFQNWVCNADFAAEVRSQLPEALAKAHQP